MRPKAWVRADWVACLPMLTLIIIGLIMIFSTSSVVGQANFNNSYYFIEKHCVFIFVGIVAFLFGLFIPHDYYKTYLLPGFFGSVFLLSLTLIPGLGVKIGGASRWLNIGVTAIQPVEIIKFYVVVFVASALNHKKEALVQFSKGLLPLALVILIPIMILALQPDLGNIGLILLVTGTLLFLSHVPFSQLAMVGVTAVMFVVGNIAMHPYQLSRIKGFLSPWEDQYGRNYHLVQSLIAVGSGGIWGRGIGESKLKFFYLPLQYSDFIFAIICEEGGFILAAIIIFLYGMLFYRGLSIARASTTLYSYYLCIGLVLLLLYQAIINMAVVTGLMPVTGIPLTFISFGGTSLVMSMFFMGVIMNISYVEKEKKYALNAS